MAKFFIMKSSKNLYSRFFLYILYGSFACFISMYLYKNLLSIDDYYINVVFFTLYQASLGASLSILLSLLCLKTVYKFSRNKFCWIINRIFSISFFLPSIIGCLSIVMIFGNNGIIGQTLRYLGFSYQPFIYGIKGIVICHLFYYIPYALRILLSSLTFLPTEYDRLAYSLNIKDFTKVKIVYFPLLKTQLYELFITIFMYCFRSFTIILILGGFPSTTTIEVALYQLLNFDFDLKTAFQLSFIQILINGGLFFSQSALKKDVLTLKTNNSYWAQQDNLKIHDIIILLVVILLFIFPILAVVLKGIPALPSIIFNHQLWWSVATSFLIGILTTVFSFFLLFSLVHLSYVLKKNNSNRLSFFLSDILANFSSIVSPIMLIAALYIIFAEKINTIYQFSLVISCLNAFCFLPSMYRALKHNYAFQRQQYDKICTLLNIRGLKRFFLIDWSPLKPSIGYCLSICFIFSIGDSRAILFFNNNHFDNLISLLYDKMSIYLFDEAAAIACFILLLSFSFSFIIDSILGKHSRD